jgi:hypothetical protein
MHANAHAAARAALLPAARTPAGVLRAPLRAAPGPLAPRRRCAPARLRQRATAARTVCTLATPLLSPGTDSITMSHADFDVSGRRVPLARSRRLHRAPYPAWSSRGAFGAAAHF